MMVMGVNSLPLVIITSAFTGMVASVQTAYQFRDYTPMVLLGSAVGKMVVIELGPVLTALVVAGRVGASISAELGTMKVTEQIDALETLAVDPIRYLALPRFVSGMIMLPVLVVLADIIAILGGMVVAAVAVGVNPDTFIRGLRLYFELRDVVGGLSKAVIFGIIIALMGCYQGFNAGWGAGGVGRATTRAVVYSCLLILIFDYIVAEIVFR
jgi:phospholipid/cholesterol/gamma-HCH transport system permease protein